MNHIIEHLSNLKFYADFKNSPAKSFDQFTDYIDTGAPEDYPWITVKGEPVVEKFSFDDPLEDNEFEDQIEEYIEKKRAENQASNRDLDEWYSNVSSVIQEILEKENAYILLKENPYEELVRILNKHQLLNNYISIKEDDFFHYCTWMQLRAPKDFFLIFSEKEKDIENYPLTHCFQRIFNGCKAYSFFSKLVEQKKRLSNADFNVIFHEMSAKEFILCPKSEFEGFVSDHLSLTIEIYPKDSKKLANPTFISIYNSVYQQMFT